MKLGNNKYFKNGTLCMGKRVLAGQQIVNSSFPVRSTRARILPDLQAWKHAP